MKKPLPSLFLLLACCLLASAAQAEKADRNKPMNIEADTLRYDDVKQLSIFSGNVVLTKGSIVVRAAQIDVRQDADGYQFGTITGVADKPAFFRQKREGMDEFIEGESELIEYDGRADVVKFVRKATLRRLRGASLADEITGGLIVYENLTDTFSVDGSTAKGAPAVPGQRVRAMLTPKQDGTTPTAPAAPSALNPSPSLRATTTLGGPPK
jgi:lipopolysaccharide export system protein LptA